MLPFSLFLLAYVRHILPSSSSVLGWENPTPGSNTHHPVCRATMCFPSTDSPLDFGLFLNRVPVHFCVAVHYSVLCYRGDNVLCVCACAYVCVCANTVWTNCSCYSIYLWGTRAAPAGGIHSRKAGRLSNYLWLLERQTTFIGEEMGGGPEVCESIRREEARIRGSDERT